MMHIIRVIETGWMKGNFPESAFKTKKQCESEIKKIEQEMSPEQREHQHFEIMNEKQYRDLLFK